MCPLPTSSGRRMITLSGVLLLLQPVLDLCDRKEAVRHIDLFGPMAVEIPANGLDVVETPFPNPPAPQQILQFCVEGSLTHCRIGAGKPILSGRRRTESGTWPRRASRITYLFHGPRSFHSVGSRKASETNR